MDLGVLVPPFDTDQLVDTATLAEEASFDFVGVPDSQLLIPELYTNLGAAARELDAVDLGPTVTNPVTRHPAVTASAITTVNAAFDGQAVLGVGSGDSAVYTLGETAAPLSELETFIRTCRTLCAGGETNHDGKPIELSRYDDVDGTGDVPVLLAASGPETLELGGRVADRVLVGSGITPEVVEAALDHVDRGAREAGRDPDAVEVWLWPNARITDDPAAHRETFQTVVAGAAHLTFQFTLDGKQVPPEYEKPIKQLVAEYDSDAHMGMGEKPVNRQLVEDLGLTDYLVDRFCLAGTPAECVDRLRRLEERTRVDGALCIVMGDPREFISAAGDGIVPHL